MFHLIPLSNSVGNFKFMGTCFLVTVYVLVNIKIQNLLYLKYVSDNVNYNTGKDDIDIRKLAYLNISTMSVGL